RSLREDAVRSPGAPTRWLDDGDLRGPGRKAAHPAQKTWAPPRIDTMNSFDYMGVSYADDGQQNQGVCRFTGRCTGGARATLQSGRGAQPYHSRTRTRKRYPAGVGQMGNPRPPRPWTGRTGRGKSTDRSL